MNLEFRQILPEAEWAQSAHRFVDLVYASALRQMNNDAAAAADVTQAVMIIVVKKSHARQLPKEGSMNAWLLNVTRYAGLQYKRAAARRDRHEAEAAKMKSAQPANSPIETDIRSALDAAILSLSAVDREVVARRYLREESVAEVAAAVGMSENTAGRRIARAIEKLRKMLARRGIVAPLVAVTAVLSVEASIRAPAACTVMPPTGHIAFEVSHRVIWKIALTKVIAAITASLLPLALAIAVVATIVKSPRPPTTAAIPPVIATIDLDSPGPIVVRVAQVVEGPSDALLKTLLASLEENRRKLRSIHIVSRDVSRMYDLTKKTWMDPLGGQGQAWIEATSPRRARIEVVEDRTRNFLPFGPPAPVQFSSYVETWNGLSVYRVYGPPNSPASGETVNSRDLKSEELVGRDFSLQLPWDQETASDSEGRQIKTIDDNPLEPAAMAKLKLSARRVILDSNAQMVELSIANPIGGIDRLETFWFDPNHGWGLVARRDTMSLHGMLVRQITRVVHEMTQAAPGIFYPTKAVMYWEERGNPLIWEHFDASSVVANEPLDPKIFNLEFPKGMRVIDYIGAIGEKRIQK